jgi:putative acetyltransferase
MQIRIANRQDEKKIVEFVETIFSEHNLKLDLASLDADLKNVEANYFGKDGAFLVAEHEQKIVGVAAANMIDESTCALRRIYIAKDFRRKGIAAEMLSIIVSILRRLDYKTLIVHDTLWDGMKPDASTRKQAEIFLQSVKFKTSAPGDAKGPSCLELTLT